jgi:hypothetical protein
MWIRTAFWIGTIKHGHEVEFRNGIDRQMIPGIKALPGVLSARALWSQRPEVGAPPVACLMLVEFARREDIDRMLSSPERQALRTRSATIAAMFDGELTHIDCEVG